MDYKKLIKSRNVRLAILKMLRFVPDRTMLRLQYRIKTGRKLDLREPKRYTEKLQWYKLYYKDPLMAQCVDKYDVRAYVEEKGLGHILNECYGVYDTVEEMDFSKLPQQFVLKDTLGGGGNAVIIVKNKDTMDLDAVKQQMRKWVNENHRIRGGGREWPYYAGKKHRIIVERYIPSCEEDGGLIDYKFFCFYGKAEYLYVVADRKLGKAAGFGIFDKAFCRIDCCRLDEAPLVRNVPRPDNYEKLLDVAQRIAKDFPHVRIDLYDQNGEILFGEMTFFDGSGYMTFDPDTFDFDMGEKFILPSKNKSEKVK